MDNLASMITAANTDIKPANIVYSKEMDDAIYEPDEQPEGLIDVPTANKRYGI